MSSISSYHNINHDMNYDETSSSSMIPLCGVLKALKALRYASRQHQVEYVQTIFSQAVSSAAALEW